MRYGTLNLQDDRFITENVDRASMAQRNINSFPISRRSGEKFVSEDFGSKTIKITGKLIGTSESGLLGILDEAQAILAIPEQELVIDDGRTYIATCSSAVFKETNFSRSIIPYELEFFSSSPFALGTNQSVGFTIPSGVLSKTVSTTISGSAFNEPILTLSFGGIAGNSGVSNIELLHDSSGRSVTISGLINRSISVVASYQDATVTLSGLAYDYVGSFYKWEIGSNSLTINLTGSNNFGITGLIEYRPRFYR